MPLVFLFFLIFFIYAELSLVIAAGEEIGALGVLAELFLSAAAGAALIRRQGLGVARRMQEAMAKGKDPVEEVSHGFFIFVGGLLLVIPGFLTDGLGLLFLIPLVRKLLIGKRVATRTRFYYYHRRGGGEQRRGPTIIEGEYEEKDGRGKKRIPKSKGNGEDRA